MAIVMGIFMFFLILIIIVIGISILKVNNYKKYIYDIKNIPSDNDAIIVLGAGIKCDGTPSDILADRLETSLEVFRGNVANVFVLSGDHSREDYNEVGAMKNYILDKGIYESIIFMDHAGFSTYDTMYRAKEIFKINKAIIVTNEYHLPRALYIARKLGIDSYGVKSDKRRYQLMYSYKKREILAQIKDFIYVSILKPKPKFLGKSMPVNSLDGRDTEDNQN